MDSSISEEQKRGLSPAQLVSGSFLLLILLGTSLLLLPIARSGPQSPEFVTALFTATSAVCLTGLNVVDTATYWSHFGQAVILILIQIGGLGIMTLATVVSFVLAGRMGVKGRLRAAAEQRGRDLGEIRTIIWGTVGFSLAIELIIALLLFFRFFFSYDYSFGPAVWQSVFHAVSAFNNAGFGLQSTNLVPFVNDAGIIMPIAFGIIVGGLGFPVLLELTARLRSGHKTLPSLTLRFTLWGTTFLLVLGTVGFGVMEWNGALKELSPGSAVMAAFFHSVSTRTAGFNSIDLSNLHSSSLLLTDFLMLLGGGSGGTAGGVKVTTAAVLVAVMVAEIRGDEQLLVGGRRIPGRTVRQAMAVFMMAFVLVVGSIMGLQILMPQFSSHQIVFETISAFATVGLTTGITPQLPDVAQIWLVALMYAGRVGPITVVAALAARNNRRMYSFPVERPFIG
ncbi:TrkH family potassium uptake protein [Corynebacterium epidermidicanis]|uniref:Trk-type K+ transport system, membrane component n=1 Tax=Corynebacterium epidermidicanis TaxID=1050174 RepID=A0A0G3GS35_9CORY|nr:potassium transporter TrkG [Corynebacterium epidermidicanis]AKK03934.1 Trk-type K+ transport system, membrane component [Corynebacterium epidermidicanis]